MAYIKNVLLLTLFTQTAFPFANEQWMNTRHLTDLKSLIKKQEIKQELKTLCFLQLNKQIIPYSCYEWIKYKKPKRKRLCLQYLNEKCQEFSIHLKNPEKIQEILKKQILSPACYKRVREQKRRIEYQLRDHSLSDIFKWYFIEDF